MRTRKEGITECFIDAEFSGTEIHQGNCRITVGIDGYRNKRILGHTSTVDVHRTLYEVRERERVTTEQPIGNGYGQIIGGFTDFGTIR